MGDAMSQSTTTRYSLPARALHWSVAALLPVQLGLGFGAEHSDDPQLSNLLLDAHFQLGVLVLALMAVRVLWRLLHGPPRALSGAIAWQRRVAGMLHAALYVLLIALPLSGYVIWIWMGADRDVFGLFELPRLFSPPHEDETGRAIAWYLHVYGAWMLSALVVLHAGVALWHQHVLKDGLIRQRMG